MVSRADSAPPGPPENFDRVARVYRWAEFLLLGTALTRCREHFVSTLGGCRSALVLGDGDGRFLTTLLRTHPDLQAIAVDSSSAMSRLAQRRTAFAASRARFVVARVPALPITPETRIDLVVTHFFLDCLSDAELSRTAQEIALHCRPGALWLVSDFAYPARQPWRWLARLYLRALYAAFRQLTGLRTQVLPEVENALRDAGFRRLARYDRLRGMLYSELWQFRGTPR
jgi:ubiquinone/menaquinone biosynthesis C-methylase UbiE